MPARRQSLRRSVDEAPSSRRFVGLMSGTSLDGVDGVVLEVSSADTSPRTVAYRSAPFPPELRESLLALAESRSPPASPGAPERSELERAALASLGLARCYASVVDALRADLPTGCEIEAVGAHGQTVRHRPDQGYSVQLLDAALLAELTGLAVVHDFRAADLAAGGEGAPLVPAFHAAVFSHSRERRAIVNIGGIANLTVCATSGGSAESGYDTGPGNTLMDAWCSAILGMPFDRDAAWAATGEVLPGLLDAMLADPYFARPGPKSTGREYFHLEWLRSHLAGIGTARPREADVQATLVELTAATIADAVRAARVDTAYLCGGGTRNPALMRRITARLAPLPVATTSALGIAPEAIEATAFAWLAWRRIDGLPGNVPTVAGAAGPRILGALHAAPPR